MIVQLNRHDLALAALYLGELDQVRAEPRVRHGHVRLETQADSGAVGDADWHHVFHRSQA